MNFTLLGFGLILICIANHGLTEKSSWKFGLSIHVQEHVFLDTFDSTFIITGLSLFLVKISVLTDHHAYFRSEFIEYSGQATELYFRRGFFPIRIFG